MLANWKGRRLRKLKSSWKTYRMIYSPHKDAEHRVAGAEHLHLLLYEVFLFSLGFSGQHENGAGSAAGVTESRHRAASPLLGSSRFLLSASAVTHSPERANTHKPRIFRRLFFRVFFCTKSPCCSRQITEIALPHSRGKKDAWQPSEKNPLQLGNFCCGSPGGVVTPRLDGQLRAPIGGAVNRPRDLFKPEICWHNAHIWHT